jgi:hypothetical protein
MRASIRQYQQQRLMKASCVETTLSSSCVLAFRQVGRERLDQSAGRGLVLLSQSLNQNTGLRRSTLDQLRDTSMQLSSNDGHRDQGCPCRGYQQLFVRQLFERLCLGAINQVGSPAGGIAGQQWHRGIKIGGGSIDGFPRLLDCSPAFRSPSIDRDKVAVVPSLSQRRGDPTGAWSALCVPHPFRQPWCGACEGLMVGVR